ncbi:MAG: hypothetical protein JWO38_4335 [Gemmataceae bacterium]|nr:hypothetical protein [Gemmataceae bacterium]
MIPGSQPESSTSDVPVDLPDEESTPRDTDSEPGRRRSGRIPIVAFLMVGMAGLALVGCVVFVVGTFIARKTPTETAKWGEANYAGEFGVRIISANLGGFECRSFGGQLHQSQDHFLVIRLGVHNIDGTKNHRAQGAHRTASLRDTLGNTYRIQELKTELGFHCETIGQIKDAVEVRGDEPVGDLLPFDRPVPAATTLYLSLSARNYGGFGEMDFEIPESAWKPQQQANR